MAENRELALVLKLVADEFQRELKNSQGALGSFNNFIKDWRTQLAAAGTALFAIAKSTANYGDQLFKTSQKIGVNVQALAGLQHAASLADVDNRQLQTGLQALTRAMVDSAQGAGEGHEAFSRIGLSATDANGKLKPMQDVLLEIADVFSKTQDGAGKTEVAMKLLGKSGAEMIPLLNSGKASITDLMAEAEKLGLVMSEKDAKAAEEFNDSITRLEAQAKGFSITIGKQLIGPLIDLMSVFNDLGSGPITKIFKMEMQGLSTIFTLIGHGVKQAGIEIETFLNKIGKGDAVKKFWDDVRAQSIAELDKSTDKRLHQIFQDQLGAQGGGRAVELAASKPQIRSLVPGTAADDKSGKEQERIAAALLDIYKSINTAHEIRKAHINEELQLMFRQEDIADEELQARESIQSELDQVFRREAQQQTQAQDTARQRERDGLIKNVQAWIDYDNQVGASTELRLEHQLDLLRANLASQLQISTEEAAKLIQFWDNHESLKADAILEQTALTAQERETIELQSLTKLAAINQQFSGDIFQGWAMGLRKYLEDTQSAFGFAADLARRTAQMMEGAFRSFFFDLMDNKIKSMKDLFKSFADFAKQMIAQVAAQLATMLVLKGLTGGFGGFGLLGGGGGSVDAGGLMGLKFASGGPVLGSGNQDTVRAMLTPGEGVLSRKGMQALAKLNAGEVSSGGDANITVNVVNSGRSEPPQVNYRKQFKGIVMDIIWSDTDFRNMLAGRA